MEPYIICHMLSSVDGKIDGAALQAITKKGDYEATGAMFQGDAWICGRTTTQQHFAKDRPFVSASHGPAGPQPVHVARRADSYAVSVDTFGKLPGIDGRHEIPAVVDGVNPSGHRAIPLKLKSVERRDNDLLWVRYEVVRP